MSAPKTDPWDQFLNTLRTLAEAIGRALEKYGPQIEQAAATFVGGERVLQAGWLPYPAVPLTNFGTLADDLLADELSGFYQHLSPSIEADLLAHIEQASLSELSGDPLREAVQLHHLGYYRAVTRLVFPALEAVVRRDVLGRRWGIDTRLQQLVAKLDVIPLYEHVPDAQIYGWTLFSHLVEHFFAEVNSAELFEKFAASSIPNRTACMHGLIDYSTFQHSLNSLIFADYVVRMVIRIRQEP